MSGAKPPSPYPKAKVIHTTRPEELWWKSFSTTIAKLMIDHKNMPLPPHVHDMADVAMKLIAHKTFGGKFADRDGAIAAYRLRAEQVRAAIPPERLLVFDVADGWKPLCRFLGHKIPKTPFPNTNSNEDFWNDRAKCSDPHAVVDLSCPLNVDSAVRKWGGSDRGSSLHQPSLSSRKVGPA